MEKELAMSQRMRPMWTHSKTPSEYQNFFSSESSSGTTDDIYVARFFNNYLPKTQKTLIDLGIGSGRELTWIDQLKGLSRVIGIDYSHKMLDFCQKQFASLSHEIVLVHDDILDPKVFPKIARLIKEPVIYVSLINSFGNFSFQERTRVLKNIKPLLRGRDRIILCLYKRPTLKMKKNLPGSFPKAVLPKTKTDRVHLAFAREYALIPYVWHSTIEKGKLPRFWYNKKTDDIVIHEDGAKIVISHRFDKTEIKKLACGVGLTVDKLITGKFMYIASLKSDRADLIVNKRAAWKFKKQQCSRNAT
jgi:hypothetical protein